MYLDKRNQGKHSWDDNYKNQNILIYLLIINCNVKVMVMIYTNPKISRAKFITLIRMLILNNYMTDITTIIYV